MALYQNHYYDRLYLWDIRNIRGVLLYYIADDDTIEFADYVVVPVVKDDHHSIAEVVKIEFFAEEAALRSLEKTKHIIRKCTDEDFDPS